MGLFGLFNKKKKVTTAYQREDLSRLTKDGELPWGWHSANRAFTQQIDAEYDLLCSAAYEAKKKGVRAEYAALASLVKYREDVKRLCAQKGECYVFWASICVNEPVSMERDREHLRHLEENMDELLKQEALVKKIKKELISIITKEPGVIQSDIYKRYDQSLKGTISNELYWMEANGIITREKSGRSYKLNMK